jgi:polysaccharide pyruvyl transferase WcaK-like protein
VPRSPDRVCYAPEVLVAVAAWTGSANAGDELVHAGLRAHLAALGLEPVVRARPALVAAVARRHVDGLVLGGGGLLQDETSALNLPYHLAPLLAARVPAVAVGLGAGPLTTTLGGQLVRRSLQRVRAMTVRDGASADVLAGHGIRSAVVAADLALQVPRPEVVPEDVVAVSLRPWAARRHRLPVALRRAAAVDERHADRAATALRAVAARTDLGLRLVALEPPKDAPLLRAVADRLGGAGEVEVIEPAPLDVPAVIGRSRAVVAMRYHAGIAAALAGRPAVLLGYSPKVGSLGDDLDARTLPWDLREPDDLAAAVVDALARPADVLEQRVADLRQRELRNRDALERLLS